nr:winged helix-turn-helix domain-containing protein [Haloarchaeobius salinus]
MAVTEDPALPDVVALLDDEYARAILEATSEGPKSAKDLSEECDASLPTVYRRAESLQECGLLREETRLQDDGNHYSVYRATLERFSVELTEGSFDMELQRTERDVADTFTDMWHRL